MEDGKKSLIQRIRLSNTWDKADWFMRYKDPKEVRGSIIDADDWLPIFLGIMKIIVIVAPIAYLNLIAWQVNRIMFFIVFGLSIPRGLIVNFFIRSLATRFIVKN